jgi:hypothetical protein
LSFCILMSLEYIAFKSEELFTFNQFKEFLECNPLAKAELILVRLRHYLLTYKQVNRPLNEYLLTITRKLIVDSFQQLLATDKCMIRKMCGPILTKLGIEIIMMQKIILMKLN